MATVDTRKNKQGEIIGYRLRCCVGRDEAYKQVWRTNTIPRPEGLTPAREKKEVQRIADEWEAAQKAEFQRTSTKVDKSKITFADFVEGHWTPDFVRDGSHKPTGVVFYEHMASIVVGYFGPKKRLAQIDAEAVKRFVKFLNLEARTQKGEPFSAETRMHVYGTLRNILNYAQRMGYITNNPCDNLTTKEKPHKEAKKVDFLDPNETRRFIACLENEPVFWRTYVNVLITAGLRRGECTGLQWRDIDPGKLTITIRRNVTIDKNNPDGFTVGSTKTGKSRIVPISNRVYNLLMELKHEQEEQLQVKMAPSAFIFCRTADPQKPLYPTSPTKWLRRFVEKNGLPGISPHDLRHPNVKPKTQNFYPSK